MVQSPETKRRKNIECQRRRRAIKQHAAKAGELSRQKKVARQSRDLEQQKEKRELAKKKKEIEACEDTAFMDFLSQDEKLNALIQIPNSPAMSVAERAHHVHEASSVRRTLMMDRYLKDETASQQAAFTVLVACALRLGW